MDLYLVCLYDAPGVKIGPAPAVTRWNIGTKQTNFRILPETNEIRLQDREIDVRINLDTEITDSPANGL